MVFELFWSFQWYFRHFKGILDVFKDVWKV